MLVIALMIAIVSAMHLMTIWLLPKSGLDRRSQPLDTPVLLGICDRNAVEYLPAPNNKYKYVYNIYIYIYMYIYIYVRIHTTNPKLGTLT